MDAVRRGQRTGFDLELLERIREGHGHVRQIPGVVVHAAIQVERNAESLSAGDYELLRSGITTIARDTLGNHARRGYDQVGGHAAVEWQLQNSLVLHHGADAGGLR